MNTAEKLMEPYSDKTIVSTSQDILFRAQMETMSFIPCFYLGCNQIKLMF